jgi:hypothetical protein
MRTCLDSGPRSFPLPDDAEAFSVPGVAQVLARFWHNVRGLRLNQRCVWQLSLSPQVQYIAQRLLMSLRASCRQLPALRTTHRSRGRVIQ